MPLDPRRVRPLWLLLALAAIGMIGALFALRDVAQRIDAAEGRTPDPARRSLPESRFSSAFSPGPRMGDLRDLLSGIEPARDEEPEGGPSPTPTELETPAPEPEPDPRPRPDRDSPRTPRQPRTPQSAG